jgi:predicted short-subunit dehydrogenase-like oxidoreductase (DUF2520 family)
VRRAAKPATPRERVGFIGAGRVGCALAWHCLRLGYPISGVADLRPEQARVVYGLLKQRYRRLSSSDVAATSDVLFLTVPDARVRSEFESVRAVLGTIPANDGRGTKNEERIVAHCSGAFGTEVFAGAREQGLGTLALHPVQSFSSHLQAIRALPGSFFAADGSASGLRFGRQLVKQLDGGWVRVRGADRPLHHAMCVFASNFVSVLFDASEEIARELGIPRRRTGVMLAPLARTVLDNIVRQGALPGLTGPVERGDAVTVAAHLQALEKRAPALSPMYRVLSGRLVEMARRKGLDRAAVRKLDKVLEER